MELEGFESFVTVIDARLNHEQVSYYNELGLPWLVARGCEFAVVLDVDEFVYVLPSYGLSNVSLSLRETIVSTFDADLHLAQISCNWYMFGSSGLVKHPHAPTGGVRLNFTLRAALPHQNKKSFVRISSLYRFKVHQHDVDGLSMNCPPSIRLNHYAVQSREYFERVKIPRGDVASATLDSHRDWNYFSLYDFSEVHDEVLRDLVLQHF